MSIRYCVDCGNGIPSRRIELVPTAARCISCEAEYETTHNTRVSIYQLEAQVQLKEYQASLPKPSRGRMGKSKKLIIAKSYPKPYQPKVNSNSKSPTQKCPHCSSFVRSNKLQRHIDQIHGATMTQPPPVKVGESDKKIATQQPLTKIIQSKYPTQKCPHCHSFVRNDRLQQHIDKVHRATSPQPPIAKPVVQPKPLMRKDPRPLATKQSGTQYSGSAVVDQPMDGSNGWHTFRDQGRFGSHPMFDSMDDESTS